jgi:hypothetical protein
MTWTEQFAEPAPFDTRARATLLDPVFAPTNYEEYLRSLKLIQNQNESDSTTKNDDMAEFVNLKNNSAGRSFTVSNDAIKYTVEEGDSLWSIVNEALTKKDGQAPAAWKTLATLRKIAEKNQMDNADLIHPGDVIDFSALTDGKRNFSEDSPPPAPATTFGAQTRPRSSNTSEVDQPESSNPSNTARTVPADRDRWYISQAGDGANWYACGATSLTMALADHGISQATESNRQKIIRETGTNTSVGFPGTSETMAQEARKRGLQAEARATTNWQEVDAQLSKGRGVIVNGTMVGKSGALIKHFVYISGKDASGNYIMGDPANAGTATWSQADLRGFITRGGPPNGYTAVWR